jgi:hypothetical protein
MSVAGLEDEAQLRCGWISGEVQGFEASGEEERTNVLGWRFAIEPLVPLFNAEVDFVALMRHVVQLLFAAWASLLLCPAVRRDADLQFSTQEIGTLERQMRADLVSSGYYCSCRRLQRGCLPTVAIV